MPRRKSFRLSPEYIERIHDEGIVLIWPGVEPVNRNDCLDRNLLNSAANQPFQGGFGVESFYPTVYDKPLVCFLVLLAATSSETETNVQP